MVSSTNFYTKQDFEDSIDALNKGLNKGKKLCIKDGGISLQKPKRGLFSRIANHFTKDQTELITARLNGLDEQANEYFQSKHLVLCNKSFGWYF